MNKNLWHGFNKTLTGDIPCCNPVSVEHIQVANPQFSPLPVVPVGTGVREKCAGLWRYTEVMVMFRERVAFK